MACFWGHSFLLQIWGPGVVRIVLPKQATSGGENEHKRKLLSPDIFRWRGGLPREGVGAKKFGVSFEAQENQTFWQDILGFLPGCPGGARHV